MGSQRLPKLVVFDLDYTLWPFWIDTHVTPPFRKDKNIIFDLNGRKVNTYKDSTQVLQTLKERNCEMAVASRTSEIEGANQLISLLDWDRFFKYKEIYPGCKVAHFEQFHKLSGIKYEEMLFFDDEHRNIKDLTKLNVTCILVNNGMTLQLLHEDFTLWDLQVDKCNPPFHKEPNGNIIDEEGKIVQLYPDVLNILNLLKKSAVPLSVASRITDICSAYQLIYLLNLDNFFDHLEIYPTKKTLHFSRLHEKTKIKYEDMCFFDDVIRNLKTVEKLGVKCFFVEKGLNKFVMEPLFSTLKLKIS